MDIVTSKKTNLERFYRGVTVTYLKIISPHLTGNKNLKFKTVLKSLV
jgi:hypothetical protein